MDRFILIDGHAILYRAFYALPPLTTSKGEPVGAVFGFCSMLWRVIQDLKPKYLAVTFDRPAPTFRQKLYVAYQAQRPKMADELATQVDLLHQVLATMGIAVFERDGYEADDVIGTLAKKATKRQSDKATKKIEVVIVSGDRDMLQLLHERVRVLAPVVGITKMVLYDKKKVGEKYGLEPSQWVDFKALMGDPSDNYPGVSGVGPKTAADLLERYGTLENIYQNLGKLPQKLAQALAEGAENAGLAKKLAQIAKDVPLKLDLKKCRLKDLKTPQVKKLFQELEFKSLWERIKQNNQGPSANGSKPDLRVAKGIKKKNGDESQLSLL